MSDVSVFSLILMVLMPVVMLGLVVGVLYALFGDEPVERGGPPSLEVGGSEDNNSWWEEVVDALDLDHVHAYPEEPPRVTGTIEDERVVVRRTWRSGSPEPVVEIELDGCLPDGFAMVSQDAPPFVAELIDREDIVVGHEQLDSEFVFHGLREREVKEFVWSEGVEEQLQSIRELPASAHIRDGSLHSELSGSLPGTRPNPARAAHQIRSLAEWAAGLRAAAEGENREVQQQEQAAEKWVAPE